MNEELAGRCAVPMNFSGRDRHAVAWVEHLYRAALELKAPNTCCRNQNLAPRVVMPDRAGSGLEGNTRNMQRLGCLADCNRLLLDGRGLPPPIGSSYPIAHLICRGRQVAGQQATHGVVAQPRFKVGKRMSCT